MSILVSESCVRTPPNTGLQRTAAAARKQACFDRSDFIRLALHGHGKKAAYFSIPFSIVEKTDLVTV
jgi:hypothetical protein